MKEVLLTQDGYDKLQQELTRLKLEDRKEIAQAIHEAAQYSELTDNPEYEDLKRAQSVIETRIAKLESQLAEAKIIETTDNCDVVGLGCVVKLQDVEFNDIMQYTIVGAMEADPIENMISNESPVGQALLGKAVGDVVEVDVPDGSAKYKIINVGK